MKSVANIETKIRCDNCSFSTYAVGFGRPVLICQRKVNFVGQWRSLPLDGNCANFEPSEAFKTDPRAPRRLPLTNGKFALLDAEDYYRLSQFNWHAARGSKTFYAVTTRKGKRVIMHREIMNAPEDLFVDHIDHDGLNNRKSNLRLCTHAQNSCNKPSRTGASKYKGINKDKYGKKWTARVHAGNKTIHIGTFATEIEAAKAYDKKAVELHGEFACLNFPPEP